MNYTFKHLYRKSFQDKHSVHRILYSIKSAYGRQVSRIFDLYLVDKLTTYLIE